ncbi:hypothetical protein JS44_14050 [Anoxybacillus flavithermus]|uniref:Uncharacterized protein n=1 Tax=Anoxybacillus flavithermus TaxID=33934 RepID=A0A094IYP5_9BACL|nr:hypothetical protein JS44_14050 [Anoxybacillus flavithermus]
MSLIGLSRNEKILKIEATDKIPRLETGGQPKQIFYLPLRQIDARKKCSHLVANAQVRSMFQSMSTQQKVL